MSSRLMPDGMLARDDCLRLRDLKKRLKPEFDRARLLGAESRGACCLSCLSSHRWSAVQNSCIL
eukprot:COSAG01_NODE_8556_length_2743_cov_8.364977_5_plen_64_part_00